MTFSVIVGGCVEVSWLKRRASGAERQCASKSGGLSRLDKPEFYVGLSEWLSYQLDHHAE